MNGVPKASRPYMPGYGIPRSTKGMVPWAWVNEQLSAAKNYWLGTTSPDGRPHSIPLWGAWLENSFYFGSGDQTRHMRNLQTNPAVVIHLENGDNVVIVEGVAELAQGLDAEQITRLEEEFQRKYGMSEGVEGMWVATPERVFAWQDGLASATRFVFDRCGSHLLKE
jgi:hypothetical protein